MKFTSASEIAKKNSNRRGGRSSHFTGISVSQVYYYERESPSRIMTIRVDSEILASARIKKGDRVDVQFSEDGKTWRLKLIDSEDAAGYAISSSTKNSKSGVIRFTWFDGMPLFGNKKTIKKAKVKVSNTSGNIKVSIGEITFSITEPFSIEHIPESGI